MSSARRKISNGAWIVAASMGYGHLRAVWPFQDMAQKGEIITADAYSGIPDTDALLWKEVRTFYEVISRFTRFPVIGDFVFSLFDKYQKIEEFYPRHMGFEDPSLQLRQTYGLMEKYSWGKHLIERLAKTPFPFVTSFAPIALMAEHWKYPGPIFLIVTDSDVSRSWASLAAHKTKIRYCASTMRSKDRLQSYGVPEKNIEVTGFPLPKESLGKGMKESLRRRIALLDPSEKYQEAYQSHIEEYLEKIPSQKKPITVSFAIGGAGAQDDIARDVMKSLRSILDQGAMRLRIILGTRMELRDSFLNTKGVEIDVFSTKEAYFRAFPKIMEQTDVLWTKPSELIFYAGLGIPFIIAPPIGSQEDENRKWLLDVGAGVDQLNPRYCHQWLPDYVASSRFAEAAMQGFVEMEKQGSQNVRAYIQSVAKKI